MANGYFPLPGLISRYFSWGVRHLGPARKHLVCTFSATSSCAPQRSIPAAKCEEWSMALDAVEEIQASGVLSTFCSRVCMLKPLKPTWPLWKHIVFLVHIVTWLIGLRPRNRKQNPKVCDSRCYYRSCSLDSPQSRCLICMADSNSRGARCHQWGSGFSDWYCFCWSFDLHLRPGKGELVVGQDVMLIYIVHPSCSFSHKQRNI